ncbi:ribonuclease domain-containing protein [Nocardioides sp.]|uniref:ribonuclease domain-containing protein n=1 Tax=Nocardioides sp. TaxID=35761 RepID=UPI00286E178E|nr:ribonuclease domain-containing protein [Nocardioides sp.]
MSTRSSQTRAAQVVPGQRSLIGLLIAVITAAVLWWTQGDGNTPGADPSPADTPSAQQTTSQTPTAGQSGTDPDSGLPIVRVSDLPPEAAETLELIDAGGPFPEDRDGVTFENREDILPQQAGGYYKEYTVETPGSDDRGARRIVTGANAELYWTDDHYSSFSRIAR